MRHRQSGRRFDMPTGQRNHMFRILTRTVLTRGGAFTTEARAKEIRRVVDRMITLGKQDSVHARRQALSFIADRDVVQTLFDDVAPRYASRSGGYTRVVKLGRRKGDAARVARVELV
ncbi:MAG: 50S ribosomal protein L17 [Chloroflexota bacterium]|jgi:large subunit ribosomal protein L17|nr:50S ribosomal protein L17 [Chloroflexota bacterium]MEC7788631.1 50S ribosomal protein L17 [Chloroflexota bacterium]